MTLKSATGRLFFVRRRPITTEAIGSAATHPSLRGALATKQSRGHNMRGASNPDGRTAAPGLLRFARNDGQGIGSLVSGGSGGSHEILFQSCGSEESWLVRARGVDLSANNSEE